LKAKLHPPPSLYLVRINLVNYLNMAEHDEDLVDYEDEYDQVAQSEKTAPSDNKEVKK